MLNTNNPGDKMEMIGVKSVYDKLLDYVGDHIDMSCFKEFSYNQLSNLTLPFCGLRCYNSILKLRLKGISNNGDSEYAVSQNWDNDGTSNRKSSMEVLIEWITTEENCSNYFGGVNEKGTTNGNRKETYHYHIRDLIQNENGELV
jgi:hypothetical protein